MEMIKNNKAAAGILGALALVGVGCWVWQLASGLGVTGMSNGVSWGLYITMFMFFGQRATNHNSVKYADAEIIVG